MLITLPKYILRELAKALGLALAIFTIVMVAIKLVDAVKDGAGFFTVISIIPNLIPAISPYVLPLAIITGTLVCYGRLAGNNEYTAAQAGGIHPFWISGPAFAVAILATIITLYLNDTLLSESTTNIRDILVSHKTDILRRKLSRPGSFLFHTAAFCRLKRQGENAGLDITFFATGPDTKQIDTPRWDPEYPHQSIRWIARDHELDLHEDEQGVVFVQTKLKDFQQYDMVGSELQAWGAKDAIRNFHAGAETTEISFDPDRISYWSFQKLLKEIGARKDDIAKLQTEMTAIPSLPPAQQSTERERLDAGIENAEERIAKYTAEINLKLALSFSCIGFALLGIPLGLRGRYQSATVGFSIGLAIAVVYVLVAKMLHSSAKVGQIPAAVIWIPSVILYISGAILWFRIRKAE